MSEPVIFGLRAAPGLGPLLPRQRTCSDDIASEKCETRTCEGPTAGKFDKADRSWQRLDLRRHIWSAGDPVRRVGAFKDPNAAIRA